MITAAELWAAHTRDPITGYCSDCGARREDIDDKIVPMACEKVVGPHRLAIMAARRDLRALDHRIADMRRMEDQHSTAAIQMHQAIPAVEAERDALAASIAALENTD